MEKIRNTVISTALQACLTIVIIMFIAYMSVACAY